MSKEQLGLIKEHNKALQSTLESMDFALNNWLTNEISPFASSNEGWKPVPIVWTSFSEAFLSKSNNGELRDKEDTIIYPIISVSRKGITKSLSRRTNPYADLPPYFSAMNGGSIDIVRRIKQDKTANFTNAFYKKNAPAASGGPRFQINRKEISKAVYETVSVQMPKSIMLTYTLAIRSSYQEQMNQILQLFLEYVGNSNYFVISHEGYRYETFIKEDIVVNDNKDSYTDEEKFYESELTIEVLGVILNSSDMQQGPKRIKNESVVDFKFGQEYTFADIKDLNQKEKMPGNELPQEHLYDDE